MYDDLLFPTDGGDGAETGLERALEAARTFDAVGREQEVVVHVSTLETVLQKPSGD